MAVPTFFVYISIFLVKLVLNIHDVIRDGSSMEFMSVFWICLISSLAILLFLFQAKHFTFTPLLFRYLCAFLGVWVVLVLNLHGSILTPPMRAFGLMLLIFFAVYVAAHGVKFFSEWCSQLGFLQKLSKMPSYLSEILKALNHMAGKKIGALIIIEKKEPLDPHLTGGIPFQADVKSEILISLFMPPSMVHDGAVIIKNGKIHKVKAVLPLATQFAVPMGVGTRHRSAIGLTERTDAIALVVSEERGEISLASGGVLHKSISGNQLEKLLITRLKQKKSKKPAAQLACL